MSARLSTAFALAAAPLPERPPTTTPRQAVSFLLLVDRARRTLLVKKKETPATRGAPYGMVGMAQDETIHPKPSYASRGGAALDRSSIEVFGDLGFFLSRVAGVDLHVFVAKWNGEGTPVPDPREIDFLAEVPFSELLRLHEKNRPGDAHPDPGRRGPEYSVDDAVRGPLLIWGVTARFTFSRSSEKRAEREKGDEIRPAPEEKADARNLTLIARSVAHGRVTEVAPFTPRPRAPSPLLPEQTNAAGEGHSSEKAGSGKRIAKERRIARRRARRASR
jgi:hypothetical protein